MVKGGLCVIGGGGLGLCSHGMGAGRLRRPGVREWTRLTAQGSPQGAKVNEAKGANIDLSKY